MRKRRYKSLTYHPQLSSAAGASASAPTFSSSSSSATAEATDAAPDTPVPVVHNIVATSKIEFNFAELDLVLIQAMLPFSFYDKKRFAAVTIRLSYPECTALLFSSGRLVITGARTWYESIYSSGYICDLLRGMYPDKVFHQTRCDIQNIVGHVELPIDAARGGKLDLDAMYQHLQLNCTYQKLLFPGLIYRPENSPVVLLCFYSGRIVITGGKYIKDIFDGWTRLWPVVRRFMLSHTNNNAPSLPPCAAKRAKVGSETPTLDLAEHLTPALDPTTDYATHLLLTHPHLLSETTADDHDQAAVSADITDLHFML